MLRKYSKNPESPLLKRHENYLLGGFMGQDRSIFDKVYKRCELFLQENPQTYLKHFSIFKKVKTQLDTIPPFKFRHFYSLLFLFYFYFSGIQLMLGTLFTLNLKSLRPHCLRFRCHLLKFHMLMCTLVDVIITPATNCNNWNFLHIGQMMYFGVKAWVFKDFSFQFALGLKNWISSHLKTLSVSNVQILDQKRSLLLTLFLTL